MKASKIDTALCLPRSIWVVHPSWLDHKVLRNRPDRQRMSPSFNASLTDAR